MSATLSILSLDARGVLRDNVMVLNVGLSAAVAVIITVIGVFRADTNWADWFPFMVAMSFVSGPAAYGFLFGLLMVDERDTGVRAALAVTPVPATKLLLIRTLTSVMLMIVWPLATYALMNSTWQALTLTSLELLPVIFMLALGAPATALIVAAFADNKVEALAMFKGINFVAIAPLALYVLPEAAEAYRSFFLIFPTAWGIFAFDQLVAGNLQGALPWILGGTAYFALLLMVAIRAYISAVYKTGD